MWVFYTLWVIYSQFQFDLMFPLNVHLKAKCWHLALDFRLQGKLPLARVYRLCKRQQDLKLIKWCLQMHHFYFLLGRYSQNNNSLVAVVLLQTEAKKILVLPCLYQGFKINLSSGKQVIHVTSHNLGLWKLNETNFRKSVQPSLLCKLINHYSFFKLQLIVSKFKICLPGFPKSSEKQKTSQLLICN